ncbi:MAG: chromate efflux transporter, partial [Verrucomicrobiales bacterium]|nr:chromate efflux transporter [Verrucomicrobiales bacterium]
MTKDQAPAPSAPRLSALTVLGIFLRLGLTSFGGPVAHIGYFHHEFVERKKWLTDQAYADLVALCQFLPGPGSSQIGIALGHRAAGLPGALAAWTGFTLPSAVAMAAFALFLSSDTSSVATSGAVHGLKLAAVAVVAGALLGMARSLCTDKTTKTIAALATVLAALVSGVGGQLAAIALGIAAGLAFLRPATSTTTPAASSKIRSALFPLTTFFLLLLTLPFLAAQFASGPLPLIDNFYRAGSLVFGGGHVVLPLLEASSVPALVDQETFLAGYGASQAVPGPLFTFASFIGASTGGIPGATIATAAIFFPSFLLVIGVIPIWEKLSSHPRARAALTGVNAAVVGLLAAAFYSPVWTSAINSTLDFALAAAAFA